MRFIDADKIHRSRASITEGLKSSYKEWFSASEIDNAPTVKAIPIDWIKDKMDKLEDIGRLEFCEYLDELLVDWEKENEQMVKLMELTK